MNLKKFKSHDTAIHIIKTNKNEPDDLHETLG